MIVETYQSPVVKKILEEGKIYKALPSINQNLNKAYKCLIQMLGLSCECPIFGVLRGYRQCTNGAGASSVKFTLDVPDDQVHLTEYDDWAQFLHNIKYISPKTVQYIVKKYLGKIEMSGYSVHKLRHTAATLMYQHGDVDIRVLKDVLEIGRAHV